MKKLAGYHLKNRILGVQLMKRYENSHTLCLIPVHCVYMHAFHMKQCLKIEGRKQDLEESKGSLTQLQLYIFSVLPDENYQ